MCVDWIISLSLRVAAEYFEVGMEVFERLHMDVLSWPSPKEALGATLDLPVFGEVIRHTMHDTGLPWPKERNTTSVEVKPSLLSKLAPHLTTGISYSPSHEV